MEQEYRKRNGYEGEYGNRRRYNGCRPLGKSLEETQCTNAGEQSIEQPERDAAAIPDKIMTRKSGNPHQGGRQHPDRIKQLGLYRPDSIRKQLRQKPPDPPKQQADHAQWPPDVPH